MKGILQEAIFSKFGLAWKELYWEDSARREYIQFSSNGDLYIAVMLKGGNQVTIYKLDKAVSLDD